MKALIAGLGSIGLRHLRNLRTLGVTDILAYRVRGQPVLDDAALGVREFHDLDAALDQRPDIVFVTNPTGSHIEVALAAAQRGCHLLIEKPLSHTLSGIDTLIDVVRERRVVAMVGSNFRMHPALRRIRTELETGTCGRPVTVRAHLGEYLPDWHPGEDWRAGYAARPDLGGGVILTQSHEVDYLCWMFGDVSRVFAMAGSWTSLGLEVEDVAEILIEFVSGVRASIHVDYVQRPPARTLEVIAERGTMRWDFRAGLLAVYSSDSRQWSEWTVPNNDDRNEMYMDELRHFLDCVAARDEPHVPLEEGRRVLEVLLAAKRSAATGQVIPIRPRAHRSSGVAAV